MTPEELAEEELAATAAAEQKEKEEAEAKALAEQDPLKTELEKVQRKGRTKVEKLQYTKQRIDEQLRELGVQDEPEDDEDAKPVTVGMLKKLQAETATKTALQLANELTNDTERELTKYHLENTIKSTGNPQEDFKLAQSIVSSVKNSQIAEELARKGKGSAGAGAGAPVKQGKQQEEFTQEELVFMKPPFNMTKEAIIKARPTQ